MLVAALLVAARFVVVGADTYWAVALGRTILDSGAIPDGVPFALAPSAGWPNVPVLGELALAVVAAPGPLGVAAAQLAADAVALVLLALACRRAGASDAATAVVLAVLVLGALPALVAVKVQLFSVLLFPALLVLLYADQCRPSRRVWWLVPLVALWGNLHGGVLVGLAVAGAYLAFSRLHRRPAETVAVGLATLLAVCANPAVTRTPLYYAGVLGNEAAQRGVELWRRPSLGDPFDLLLAAAALVLLVLVLRSRPAVWEVVVVVGLAVLTVTAARHGVWLLAAAAVPAARAVGRQAPAPATSRRTPVPLLVATVAATAAAAVLLAVRAGEVDPSNDPAVLDAVRDLAAGRVVLADEPLAEALAADGTRIWLSNPLDAFPRGEQAAYLEFVSGNSSAALDASTVVVVRTGGPADRLLSTDPRFGPVRSVAAWSVYARVR